jgi:hypothetical protein
LLERTATIWKLHAEAFFGYEVLLGKCSVPGLRERVARALTALDQEAAVSAESTRIGDDPPASAKEIRDFTSEIRKRLDALKPPEHDANR